jgi:hypothetical protein
MASTIDIDILWIVDVPLAEGLVMPPNRKVVLNQLKLRLKKAEFERRCYEIRRKQFLTVLAFDDDHGTEFHRVC